MNILTPNPRNYIGQIICTHQFSYNKATKRFVGEASTIGQNFLGQLYEDACDQGFLLLNQKTGNAVPFYLFSRVKVEGEIQSWEFAVCPEAVRKAPHLKELTVIIFND